jgi:prepilin-type N-terminal cleavage/methylation domain-containing protein
LSNKGFSLVEVIVAVGIFSIIAYSGVASVVGSFSSNRLSGEQSQATFLAQEGIEAIRSIRDQSWDNLIDGSHYIAQPGLWQLTNIPSNLGIFNRTIDISSVDVDTKKVVSSVSWQFTSGRGNSLALTSYFTNWRSSVIPISDCYSHCQQTFTLPGNCVKQKDCSGQNEGKVYECGGPNICCCSVDGPTPTPTLTPTPIPTSGPTPTLVPTNCYSHCQQTFTLPGNCVKKKDCSGQDEGKIYECGGRDICCCQ